MCDLWEVKEKPPPVAICNKTEEFASVRLPTKEPALIEGWDAEFAGAGRGRLCVFPFHNGTARRGLGRRPRGEILRLTITFIAWATAEGEDQRESRCDFDEWHTRTGRTLCKRSHDRHLSSGEKLLPKRRKKKIPQFVSLFVAECIIAPLKVLVKHPKIWPIFVVSRCHFRQPPDFRRSLFSP